LPATSVRFPPLSILKTALPLLKYVLPLLSTVTRLGCPMEVLVAVTGVGAARRRRQWLTYIAAPIPKSCLPAAEFRTAFQPVSTFTLPFLSGNLKDE
jgi:hypothetical protein